MSKELPALRFGTGWISLEVLGEADVVLTVRGYAPVLPVRDLSTGLDYLIYVGARSLGEKLEELRKANGRRFSGLRVRICKESAEQMAKYRLEPLKDEG